MSRSYAEKLLAKTLPYVLFGNPEIFINYRPKWLINPETGKRLELDVYLPKLRLAFEVQGPYHFEELKQVKKDILKKEICASRNIALVELGIFQLNPFAIYSKLCKLKKTGRLKIDLKYPAKDWHEQSSEIIKYKEKIRAKYGSDHPCQATPKHFFRRIQKQLIKEGWSSEIIDKAATL